MERLSTEISAGVVIPVERYYFSLPTGRAHTSHDVPHFPKPGTQVCMCPLSLRTLLSLCHSVHFSPSVTGRHFSPLHHSIVENIFNILKTGNTYIDDITQLTTEFTQQNLLTELTINSGDESLIVTREKVNGHIYHGFIDRQVVLPEPVRLATTCVYTYLLIGDDFPFQIKGFSILKVFSISYAKFHMTSLV